MSKNFKYSGIIFDLDGTLIDSIPIYEESFLHMIKEAGSNMTKEEFLDIYNNNIHLSAVIRNLKIDASEKDMRKVRDENYMNLLRNKIEWFPDAKKFLDSLPKELPRAILTGSWMKYIDAIETRLPISDYFETIVTCDDFLPKGKPDPHGLLIATERLSLDPEKCVYIGDQAFDITAAHNAGMDGILIKRTKYSPEDVEDIEMIVDELGELGNYIY